MESTAATGLGVLVLAFGVGIGICLRLLVGHIAGDPPQAALLWTVELALAAILGAAVGFPLFHDPAEFQALGGGLGFGLTAYAATSGVLAIRARASRRLSTLFLGIAHFFATSAAATVGVLIVVEGMRWG